MTNKTSIYPKLSSCTVSRQHMRSTFFAPAVQPKLSINPHNDVYEQEADAMAEKIVSPSDHENNFFRPATDSIQRKCSHCKEEEKKVQKKSKNSSAFMNAPAIANDVIHSNGHSLDTDTKNFMESRFGSDFSNVQIHNDSLAHQSSSDINALAYTHGNHIVFGKNQYQPNTQTGKQLLAHELTHVIQQADYIQTKRLPCKSERSIDVYTISLPGSTRDTFSDVAFANTILCQCGIELNIVGGESWATNLMDKIPPNNSLNEYSSPGSPTTEEVEMLSHQPGGKALHMYFVPALSSGSEAESFWSSGFPTVNNGVAVADYARNCAVAHEIGHVLLDDGSHHPNKDNLMASGKVNTCAGELEQSQCNKMK